MSNGAVDMSVTLGRMRLKNPVMPASGTFGYGEEFADFVDLNALGAVVVKGTTLHPKLGNPQIRMLEVTGGAIFGIGFQNVGVERFIADKLPYLRRFSTPVIVNIGGESIEDIAAVAERLGKAEGVAALEINISCTNVKSGGMQFGGNPETVFRVVKAVRDVTDLTIIPKLTPHVSDIKAIGRACEEAGADAVSLINALVAMAIDVNTRRSRLGKNLTGGVTGPYLKPIAVNLVWQVAQAVRIPVIGGGGITCAEDALEFLIAGATAVQVGTYNLIDPRATIKIIDGIRQYLVAQKIGSVRELIGSLITA